MYNIRHITVIFRKPISDKVEAKLLSDLQPVTGTVPIFSAVNSYTVKSNYSV